MFSKRLLVLAGSLVLLGVSATVPARAAAFGITYDAVSQACVVINQLVCDPHELFGINVPNPVTINPLSSSESSGGQNAFATVYGSIGFGQIKGYVQAQAGNAIAGANFQGIWDDTVTVTSGSLPYGTPVSLLLTLDLDATLQGQGPGGMILVAEVALIPNNLLSITATSTSVLHISEQMLVTSFVGAVLPFEGELNPVNVSADSHIMLGNSSYTIDASNTANFYLDVQTPGASYSTASGYTYFTPATPEPSSLFLTGTGLMGILSALRRRCVSRRQTTR